MANKTARKPKKEKKREKTAPRAGRDALRSPGRSAGEAGAPPRATERLADVFISYSHKDRLWKDWLLGDELMSNTLGTLEVWSDDEIRPSDDWGREIQTALEEARVAVLLVSKNFLESKFVRRNELPRILDKRREEGSRMLWIPIDVDNQQVLDAGLGEIQAAWPIDAPLSQQSAEVLAAARVQICERIEYALDPVGAKIRRALPAKYEVVRRIGSGPSKAVYLARDHVMKRWVSVTALNDRDEIEWFRQSLLYASRVDDLSGFMTVYDAWLDKNPPHCVRQFIEGDSLKDRLRHHGMRASYALDILLRVGRALESAHARGFYHLNVKPSNVLIDQDDRAFLSPLSRRPNYVEVVRGKWERGDLSEEDRAYAVPELFARAVRRRFHPRCDQYMLGLLACQMLTRELPMRLKSSQPPRKIKEFQPLPDLDSGSAECPPGLAKIIARMTQRYPEKRFAMLGECLDELEGIRQSLP